MTMYLALTIWSGFEKIDSATMSQVATFNGRGDLLRELTNVRFQAGNCKTTLASDMQLQCTPGTAQIHCVLFYAVKDFNWTQCHSGQCLKRPEFY